MRWHIVVSKVDPAFMLFGELLAKAPDSGHDAQIVELLGLQLAGQGLNIAGYLRTLLVDFFQPLFLPWRSSIAIGNSLLLHIRYQKAQRP